MGGGDAEPCGVEYFIRAKVSPIILVKGALNEIFKNRFLNLKLN